jgi:8-oxo-dGTP pyrophosphatase MutT (NUDIX family)
MSKDEPYQIVSRKTIWEGKYIKSLLLEYKDDRGGVRTWEAVERINCNGVVAIIPITSDGHLLMIRQFRPSLNRHVIEFPAGLNDKGESLLEAAKRELIEETGYTSDSFEFIADGPISSGLSTEILTVYVAKDVVHASAELRAQNPIDETENIELLEVPIDAAYETIEDYRRHGDLADIKIYGFIELARQRIGK